MTPISRPLSIFRPEENMCLAPEDQVCRAPEAKVASAPSRPHLPDFRALAHQRYTQSLLRNHSLRSALASSAFSSAPRHSIFDANPVAFTPLVASPAACSTHAPLDDKPPPGDPPNDDPTDGENPPITPGGNDGGLGNGIQTAFADSQCERPVDLDLASDTSSLLMTCSDLSGEGNGILERINASTGDVEPLLLPNTLENEPNKAVYLTSAASTGNGTAHVGFAAVGSSDEFVSGDRDLGNSGIFITPESDPNVTSHVLFNPFQIRAFNAIQPISLAGVRLHDAQGPVADLESNPPATVNSFTPNTPVSQTRLGNQLFVLTRNVAINHQNTFTDTSDDTLDLAPATILRYDVNGSGALTASPVGDVGESYVIAGSTERHNGIILDGSFNPSAIGTTDDGRIVAVTQGIPGENATSLHVFNPDFTPGITSGAGSSEIIVTDAANPDFDFVVNDSSQLTIVGNQVLLGSFDGSGRVALVDVSAAGPSGGGSRIRFAKVFDDGSDIANIVANPNGQYAYVISDTGKIRTLTLTPDSKGKFPVGNIYTLAGGLGAGTTVPANFRASSVIAARPGGYSKAPIQ